MGDQATLCAMRSALCDSERTTDNNTMIQLIHLTKRFGRLAAVNDVTLEVPSGEIFGFLGPNGAAS